KALTISNQIAAPEEQWKAVLILARIAEAGNDASRALALYTQAISTIEHLRTTISTVSLRSALLGDKTEAYDGALRMALRAPDPVTPDLFRLMEQIRARTLRDSMSASSTTQTLATVQKRLSSGEALLEYWKSGDDVAALWVTH